VAALTSMHGAVLALLDRLPKDVEGDIELSATSESHRSGCDIKGNINSKGERIYHPPGGRSYANTVIDPARGERWFCSEAEAQAAGWRRTMH
jgi:hypothetical protein